MIIDTIKNASKYFGVHPLFSKAFDYINSTDLASTEVGKYEIDGDNLKAIISSKKGMTQEESVAKFECHDRHIDIQLCIDGNEKIGWKPREKCTSPKGEYNPEQDDWRRRKKKTGHQSKNLNRLQTKSQWIKKQRS
jgi:biofilm protein TabA